MKNTIIKHKMVRKPRNIIYNTQIFSLNEKTDLKHATQRQHIQVNKSRDSMSVLYLYSVTGHHQYHVTKKKKKKKAQKARFLTTNSTNRIPPLSEGSMRYYNIIGLQLATVLIKRTFGCIHRSSRNRSF